MQDQYDDIEQQLKSQSLQLKPNDVQIISTLETDEHYTMVCFLPEIVREKIEKSMEHLPADSALVWTPSNLYHITICSFDLDGDVKAVVEAVKNYNGPKLSFDLGPILVGPPGPCIPAFPLNKAYLDLNQSIGQTVQAKARPELAQQISWITLARYLDLPQQQTLDVINTLEQESFGSFVPDELTLCKTSHKFLKDAEIIERIQL